MKRERQWLLGSLAGYAGMGVAACAVVGTGLVAPAWWLIPVALLLLLVGSANLDVRLDPITIRLAYWPFWRRSIRLSDLASAQAVTYRPMRDFGGWGIRLGGGAVVYSIAGKQAIRLALREGRDVLVGVRDPAAWAKELARYGVRIEPAGAWRANGGQG